MATMTHNNPTVKAYNGVQVYMRRGRGGPFHRMGWLVKVRVAGRLAHIDWSEGRDAAASYAVYVRKMVRDGFRPRAIEGGLTWDPPLPDARWFGSAVLPEGEDLVGDRVPRSLPGGGGVFSAPPEPDDDDDLELEVAAGREVETFLRRRGVRFA